MYGECEKAIEIVQEGGTLQREKPQRYFGIAVTAEALTARFQLRAQVLVVEDLPVEGDGVAPAVIGEGLVTSAAGVYDAQTPMTEYGAPTGVHPFIVRTAMRDAAQSRADAIPGGGFAGVYLI